MDPTFDQWVSSDTYPTLFKADRQVYVDLTRVFPGLGDVTRRHDELPLWVRACGLRLELQIPGRQLAWVRRADGGWLANCVCWPGSANGQSRLRMQLWVEPQALTPLRGQPGGQA